MKNAENISIAVGSKFNPLSNVKATDNVDGDLTKFIRLSRSVNTKQVGKYIITYTVTDKAGNKTEIKRVVIVVDRTKLVQSVDNTTIAVGSKFISII